MMFFLFIFVFQFSKLHMAYSLLTQVESQLSMSLFKQYPPELTGLSNDATFSGFMCLYVCPSQINVLYILTN